MVASIANIRLSPTLILECLLHIDKPSIISSIKQQQQQQPFESLIIGSSNTSIIRLLTNVHNVRISKLQTKMIINTFKDFIINIFKELDINKLQELNELKNKAKSSDQFIKTFEKNGYKIRIFTTFELFIKIIDDYLITDYILIKFLKMMKKF